MFGRVRRAGIDEDVEAAAVLHTFSPQAVAGALAVGMGSAGIASSGALAMTADGRQVSPMAEAVDGAIDWGRREQRRFLRLPHRVLVIVTSEAVTIHEWSRTKGRGRQIATWPAKSYMAARADNTGEIGVRVTAEGKIAILTGPRGPQHRAVHRTVEAIVRNSSSPDP